ILLTSHYMADITALCERVLLIHQGELMYDGNLETLVERFAPYREVTIELSEGVDPDRLRTYGELEIMDGQEVRFLVQREALTTAIAKILAELPVLDLSINDPPIEEVIGRLFASGRLETRSEDI
ncbi:MAG: hypothetical protein RLZZ490_684, partial [Cyanobacteriota bacterium]